MWLANWRAALIPHGVFLSSDFPHIEYLGKPVFKDWSSEAQHAWAGEHIYRALKIAAVEISSKNLARLEIESSGSLTT